MKHKRPAIFILALIFLSGIPTLPNLIGQNLLTNNSGRFSNGFPNDLVYSPRGKGRSMGHIIDLNINNPTNTAILLADNKVIIPGVVGTQVYVSRIPELLINPGETVDIPLQGESLTLWKSPLANGQIGSPVKDWFTTSSPGPFLLPEKALPGGFDSIDNDRKDFQLTYPGTYITLDATIDLQEYLDQAVPLIFAIEDQIDSSYQELWDSDQITIPIPPDRAFKEGRQQVKWHVYSVLEGKPYKRRELEGRLYAQLEAQLKRPLHELPISTQQRLNNAVEEIWKMILLVSKDAKVIKG